MDAGSGDLSESRAAEEGKREHQWKLVVDIIVVVIDIQVRSVAGALPSLDQDRSAPIVDCSFTTVRLIPGQRIRNPLATHYWKLFWR